MNNFSFQSATEQELPLQTSWEDAPARDFTLSSIDFETDKAGRPIEIGLARIHLGTGEIDRAFWTRLSGEGGCLQAHYPSLCGYLRDGIMLAHNKATERRCLFAGLVVPPPARLWVDSLNVFRALLPLLGSYSLSDLVSHLGLDVDAALAKVCPEMGRLQPHHALWDTISTGLAVHALISRPGLEHLSLRQLSTLMPSQGIRPRVAHGETAGDWNAPITG
jgi:hypothetical protein